MDPRAYPEDATGCVIAWLTTDPLRPEAERVLRAAPDPEAAAALAAWTRDQVLGRDWGPGPEAPGPGPFRAELAAIARDWADWDHVARALRIVRDGEDWVEDLVG